MHGLAHIDRDEDRAAWELHGLRPRFLTHEQRQPTVDDLAAVGEPLAALTVELPLRLAGCVLPDCADLAALCAAVAGPEPFAAQVRTWRTRHGGTLAAEVPGWSVTECHVGEAVLGWTPEEYTAVLADLLDRAGR